MSAFTRGRARRALSSLAEAQGASATGSSLRTQLKVLFDGRRGLVAALVVGAVLSGLTEAALLASVAEVAAAMVNHASRARISLGPVHAQANLAIVLTFAGALVLARLGCQVIVAVVPALIVSSMQVRMRGRLLSAYMGASWTEQARDREGLLQELMTNQVAQAVTAAMQVTSLIVASVTFVVLVVAAIALNLFVAALIVVTSLGLFALLRPLSKIVRRLAAELSRVAVECATGINQSVSLTEEAQVFGTSDAQRRTVMRLVEALRPPQIKVFSLTQLTPGVYQSGVYLLLVIALAVLYVVDAAHIASLGAVVLLLVRAGMYGQQVQTAYQNMLVGLPYVDRIATAERRYLRSTPPDGHVALGKVESLEFENVSYAYDPARPVLSDITFAIRAGETVGIVGPTGAGKSTVVQLLLGLRPPDAGRYLVNGTPREEIKARDWKTRVAYLPQQPRVLHASVADNIRFFRELPDEDIHRAARLANIHDDIAGWPAGYDTVIGPRVAAVSGGQQQRICLARALAASPQVLVLDEPTSALDPVTESLIQESLTALRHSLTLVIVAHRMSTLDVCDRLMVIRAGRLEAIGSVWELQRDSEYYRLVSELMQSGSASRLAAVK